jgi:hypothetical protein
VTFHGQYATAGLGYDVFQSIVPVTLAPGFYEVDAVGFSGSDLNGNRNEGSPSGPVLNNLGGALTFAAGDSTYSFLQTIVFPTDFNGNSINGGVLDTNGAGPGPGDPDANYLALYDAGTFAATPEPGSLFLLATGLFGLAIILFRRAKASRTVLTT